MDDEKALHEPDASGYAAALLALRQATDRFESLAAMVASNHRQHLPEASKQAAAAVIAARMLAAWCHTQAFEVPHG